MAHDVIFDNMSIHCNVKINYIVCVGGGGGGCHPPFFFLRMTRDYSHTGRFKVSQF